MVLKRRVFPIVEPDRAHLLHSKARVQEAASQENEWPHAGQPRGASEEGREGSEEIRYCELYLTRLKFIEMKFS